MRARSAFQGLFTGGDIWLTRTPPANTQTHTNQVLEPGVGVAGTTRWYDPVGWSVSDWVRHQWNTVAMSTMIVSRDWPWTGAAIRREVVDEVRPPCARVAISAARCLCTRRCCCALAALTCSTLCHTRTPAQLRTPQGLWLEEMSRGVDDVAMREPLRRGGWRYSFVPSACNVDRDAAPALYPHVTGFIRRQVAANRPHHRQWRAVLFFFALMTVLPLAAAVIAVASATARAAPWRVVGYVCAAVAAHHIAESAFLVWLHATIRSGTAAYGVHISCGSARMLAAALTFLPLTKLVNIYTSVWAAFTPTLVWRGVHYAFVDRPVPALRIVRDEQDDARNAAAKAGKPRRSRQPTRAAKTLSGRRTTISVEALAER